MYLDLVITFFFNLQKLTALTHFMVSLEFSSLLVVCYKNNKKKLQRCVASPRGAPCAVSLRRVAHGLWAGGLSTVGTSAQLGVSPLFFLHQAGLFLGFCSFPRKAPGCQRRRVAPPCPLPLPPPQPLPLPPSPSPTPPSLALPLPLPQPLFLLIFPHQHLSDRKLLPPE